MERPRRWSSFARPGGFFRRPPWRSRRARVRLPESRSPEEGLHFRPAQSSSSTRGSRPHPGPNALARAASGAQSTAQRNMHIPKSAETITIRPIVFILPERNITPFSSSIGVDMQHSARERNVLPAGSRIYNPRWLQWLPTRYTSPRFGSPSRTEDEANGDGLCLEVEELQAQRTIKPCLHTCRRIRTVQTEPCEDRDNLGLRGLRDLWRRGEVHT